MIGWKGITKAGHRTSLRELRRLVDDEVGIQWLNAVCEINGFGCFVVGVSMILGFESIRSLLLADTSSDFFTDGFL